MALAVVPRDGIEFVRYGDASIPVATPDSLPTRQVAATWRFVWTLGCNRQSICGWRSGYPELQWWRRSFASDGSVSPAIRQEI